MSKIQFSFKKIALFRIKPMKKHMRCVMVKLIKTPKKSLSLSENGLCGLEGLLNLTFFSFFKKSSRFKSFGRMFDWMNQENTVDRNIRWWLRCIRVTFSWFSEGGVSSSSWSGERLSFQVGRWQRQAFGSLCPENHRRGGNDWISRFAETQVHSGYRLSSLAHVPATLRLPPVDSVNTTCVRPYLFHLVSYRLCCRRGVYGRACRRFFRRFVSVNRWVVGLHALACTTTGSTTQMIMSCWWKWVPW